MDPTDQHRREEMPIVTGGDPLDEVAADVSAYVAESGILDGDDRRPGAHDLHQPLVRSKDQADARDHLRRYTERAIAEQHTDAEQLGAMSREVVPANVLMVSVPVPFDEAAAICQQRHGAARAELATILDVRETVAEHLLASLAVRPSAEAWLDRIMNLSDPNPA